MGKQDVNFNQSRQEGLQSNFQFLWIPMQLSRIIDISIRATGGNTRVSHGAPGITEHGGQPSTLGKQSTSAPCHRGAFADRFQFDDEVHHQVLWLLNFPLCISQYSFIVQWYD